MQIAFIIIGVILLFIAVILLIGWLSPKTYKGRIKADIPASPDRVFDILADIESLPMRRKEIEKIEMLAPTGEGRKHWREIAKMGGFAEFETIAEKQGELIEVKMVRSSFGLSGKWKYTLEETDNGCSIHIEEESRSEKLLIRSLMVLAGRKATLKQEIHNLKKALAS